MADSSATQLYINYLSKNNRLELGDAGMTDTCSNIPNHKYLHTYIHHITTEPPTSPNNNNNNKATNRKLRCNTMMDLNAPRTIIELGRLKL
jgi:hypothetical protein